MKEQKPTAPYRSFINHANRLLPRGEKKNFANLACQSENHTREPNVCQFEPKLSTMKYLCALSNMRLTNRLFSLSKLGLSHAPSAHQTWSTETLRDSKTVLVIFLASNKKLKSNRKRNLQLFQNQLYVVSEVKTK